MSDLASRLSDEADLCRNDGADDIANLLDEARRALVATIDALESIETISSDDYQNDYLSRLTEIRGRSRWGLMQARGEA